MATGRFWNWIVSRRSKLMANGGELFSLFVLVSFVYIVLFPASHEWFHGLGQTQQIGDDTDLRALTWQYRVIQRTLFEHPTWLLFGSIFTPLRDAPEGATLWIPWIERVLVPPLYTVSNDGTIACAVVFCIMVFNGLAMMWFAKVSHWPRLLGLAAALSFAVTPFTRARASVHTALAGIFFIPLVFGSLELLSRLRRTDASWKKDTLHASIALFFSCFVAHYFILLVIILSPFLFAFFVMRARSAPGERVLIRVGMLILASLPALLFLAWNFKFPTPPGVVVANFPYVNERVNLEYLHTFAADPLDYFSNDVKFTALDVFPSRQAISEKVIRTVGGSNYHERANGIRWSMLALGLIGGLAAVFGRSNEQGKKHSLQLRRWMLLFTVVAFLSSLSPAGIVSGGIEIGPSLLVHKVFENFRVPSRFGPVVGFAVIVVACEFVASLLRGEGKVRVWASSLAPLALSLISLWEFYPKAPMLMAPLRPVRTELVKPNGFCGMGIFLPWHQFDYLAFEETRGTNCELIYPVAEPRAQALMGRLGWVTQGQGPAFAKFVKCTGLDWVVFRPSVPEPVQNELCEAAGFERVSPIACRSKVLSPVTKKFDKCL